eukprot:1160243-Pelagomonas_calceolata.AAC.3
MPCLASAVAGPRVKGRECSWGARDGPFRGTCSVQHPCPKQPQRARAHLLLLFPDARIDSLVAPSLLLTTPDPSIHFFLAALSDALGMLLGHTACMGCMGPLHGPRCCVLHLVINAFHGP